MRLEGTRLRRTAPGVALIVLLSVGLVGCGLDEAQEQNLVGPADVTLSTQLTADPDVVNADGVSYAVVTLILRDENGLPVANKAVEFWFTGGGDGELRPAPNSLFVGPIQTSLIMATDESGITRMLWIAATSPGSVTIQVRPYGIDARRGFYRQVTIWQQ
jgi:hypothetical protein